MESPPAPWQWRQNSAAAAGPGPGQISPSVEVIVIILTVAFVVSALLHVLIRYLSRRHDSPPAPAPAPAPAMHMNAAYDAGVADSVMESLPTFAFGAVKGGAGVGVECAICLAEFRGDDTLRLLPACRHAFHVSCVDAWLLSHATCPLCRTPVLPPDCDDGGAGKADSGEHPADADSAAVWVRLGKLRRSASTRYGGDGTWQADVARRCFSTGHFDYVIDQAPRSVDAGSIRWQQQPLAVKEQDVDRAMLIALNHSHHWCLSEADVASAVSDLNV